MNAESLLIAGTHITLRDWRTEDVSIVRAWLEPRHRWHELDAPYFPRPTAEERDAFCAALAEQIESGRWETPRRRVVIAERISGQLIGTVSWYWESRETNWRRMGIVIYDPAYWGRGIGMEAFTLWTDYLFRSTDVVRLDFATWSGNIGMMRVGEKLGFILEGRFRNARIVRGAYFDSIVMGILREEWHERSSAPSGASAM